MSPIRDKSVSCTNYFLRSCTKVASDSLISDVPGPSVNLLTSGGQSLNNDPDHIGVDGALGAVYALSR